MAEHNDTIYALASGSVPAGVAVVRVSGPTVRELTIGLVGVLPTPRRAMLRTIRTRNDLAIDSGLVVFFPGPASFTGEDVVEFQLHGGRAVVDALCRELNTFPHTRQALAGEFSRRAFDNGRMDLVEVEGLADLISAETEMQRRLAVEHSNGGLSALYSAWASRLTRGRALIEAELDFADEDDVPGSVSDQVWDDMELLSTELDQHLRDADAGEIIRDGFKVVIAGEPNAGKSSLMNALVRRDVAIVTDIAGTTRDVLSTDLNIDGYLVRLSDTAGLRHTEEVVEREGIRRARQEIARADLVLYLEDRSVVAQAHDVPAGALRVGTKGDLQPGSQGTYDVIISVETGEGLPELRQLITTALLSKVHVQSLAIPNRRRHKDSLTQCVRAIRTALLDSEKPLDLRAEDLRVASDALGRVTGHVDVENLLDVIFGEFCIGK
ncbi:tRNA uridine-5-carboxymethylaminomethyl(34) synthesis GTPase MnmE [Rhizobium grahamii]|uniref:tRNA modification GTPase MnmE n=1 Tax=Rhizobium grahamii TaxID=1120045 RepID=A0A5Q0CDI7_9HYPH|nr:MULTISPECIES: tRNA uridine-5-carboxymethylaminomethyl(34) synthesis GTPase MnmE [Rhizobium]QFY61829.1 tRNA uridine-5-carboxymethylaminomethyl(34) synthesis GTPase MnmE [Rhizobium grahamii]QRM48995.1 tRNA uridine-5-carboxymethylaminomethyl(34) synthesis GTPase MnmE [Rhizobium sp. BG6]